MTGILPREGKGRADTQRHKKQATRRCVSDGSDMATNQGMPSIASSYRKVKKGMANILPQSVQGESTVLTLISDL